VSHSLTLSFPHLTVRVSGMHASCSQPHRRVAASSLAGSPLVSGHGSSDVANASGSELGSPAGTGKLSRRGSTATGLSTAGVLLSPSGSEAPGEENEGDPSRPKRPSVPPPGKGDAKAHLAGAFFPMAPLPHTRMPLPKAFVVPKAKGPAVKPMPPRTALTTIAGILTEKFTTDNADDKAGNKRQAMAEFTRDYFLSKMGLKSIANRNLRALLACCSQVQTLLENQTEEPSPSQRMIGIFCFISGFAAGSDWSEDAASFLLLAIQRAFPTTKAAREALESPTTIPFITALQATAEACKSKYSTTEPKPVLETIALLLPSGAKVEDSKISIFNWLSLITGEWRRGQASRHLDLRHLYRMFDANGDNVLDLREFTDMTRFVVPKLSDRVIMQLFNEAHAEEGEDTDVMDLERFCSVMIQNRFCPPFIDFSKVQGVTK